MGLGLVVTFSSRLGLSGIRAFVSSSVVSAPVLRFIDTRHTRSDISNLLTQPLEFAIFTTNQILTEELLQDDEHSSNDLREEEQLGSFINSAWSFAVIRPLLGNTIRLLVLNRRRLSTL